MCIIKSISNNVKSEQELEETAQPNKADIDIDSIVNRLAELSINQVEQEKLNRSEVKNIVKNLVTET
ncbi:17690_t:CDS:2, partial [Racocetra persica]